ncbi:MAG: hypothetical protein KTR30_16995 [Saprospiraceae bacterium]|nr:hypothetical protein [Saprospiraceae bacterium]
MQVNKGVVLFCLFLSLCFIQCSPPKGGIGKGNEMWHGRWQWEETRFVRRGGESITKPEDLGMEMEIELLSDGTMKVFHDKKLVKNYTYVVKQQMDFLLFEPKMDHEHTPGIETGILRCTKDSLEIVGGANDAGGNQLFRRIK